VDQIIVAMGDRRGNLPVQQLLGLKAQGIDVRDGMDVYEALNRQVHVDSARLTSWLLFSGGYRVSKGMLFYKRLCSVIFSLLGFLVTLPLMGLIALVIRLDSEGPAIFRQERVGKDGKIFTLFKFRSMFDGADQDGKHKPAQIGDGRCTRVGRVLRRTRLDELPQLYNILRGDMYFIGPRPFVPDQEEKLATKIPYYEQRWTVKPGATGWAQVSRGYCATIEDNVEKLSYDLFYIKNMSMGLDFLVFLKTLKVLLLGRGGR
jgi:lipopolysaccharide/colanic/teichoic acid biosynthesis glycosyltransferase